MNPVHDSGVTDCRNTRRYSANNCGITRGYRVWDAVTQSYELGGRRFKNQREAMQAAEALEAVRTRHVNHYYTVWQDVPQEHRPIGALWMRPEQRPVWSFKTEEEAQAFVQQQKAPETWRIFHSGREY